MPRANLKKIHERIVPPTASMGSIPCEDAEFIYDAVQKIRPDEALEIGVNSGVSSGFLLYALDDLGTHKTRRLVSYDIRATCEWNDKNKVGFCIPQIAPDHKSEFHLVTGAGRLSDAKALMRGGRRLFFIDGNHHHPSATLDLLEISELLQKGDAVILHDTNLPNIYDGKWMEYAALYLFEALGGEKVLTSHPSKNIGYWIFDGNVEALYKSIKHCLEEIPFQLKTMRRCYGAVRYLNLLRDRIGT